MSTSPKTVAFFGASTGVGLSALKHTLAAGHNCTALCRVPSKLTSIFPPSTTPNLKVIEGDIRDLAAISRCLRTSSDNLVDTVVFTVGAKMTSAIKFTIDDPEVCRAGAATLLEAITDLRSKGASGKPFLIACSSTGLSKFGRDIPIPYIPLYRVLLKTAHVDKKIMEATFMESQETSTIVRCSLLTNGESKKAIRVGIEDPKTGKEKGWNAYGYTISREDAGKWIAENLVLERTVGYENKNIVITY